MFIFKALVQCLLLHTFVHVYMIVHALCGALIVQKVQCVIRCPPQRTLDTRSVCSTSDTAPLPEPALKTIPCSSRAWEGGEGKSGGAGHNAVLQHKFHTPILILMSKILYPPVPILQFSVHVHLLLTRSDTEGLGTRY